jgi:hypothetical protein
MNRFPDAPAVLMVYYGQYTWLVPECPFCGCRHTHGGGVVGEDDPREFMSWRYPHCNYPPPEAGNYLLVEIDPKRTDQTIARAKPERKRK